MNLQFDQSTMPISVAKGASFKSEDINAFTKATAGDFATLSSLLNDNVFKILNTLPAFYDPENSHLDGKGFYVDSDSTIVKDNGLFYLNDTQNASNSRPLTVYETFILIMQILANIENAQREGVTVGSYANKVAVSSTSSLTYVWHMQTEFISLIFLRFPEAILFRQLLLIL